MATAVLTENQDVQKELAKLDKQFKIQSYTGEQNRAFIRQIVRAVVTSYPKEWHKIVGWMTNHITNVKLEEVQV